MRSKLAKLAIACFVAGTFFCHNLAHAQSAEGRSDWPGAGQLYVGTNYQPFDRADRDQIQRDIDRMKQAGMKVVRMGDLAWDAFEPAEGKFDFKLFDRIMDRMQAAGLKVIMDIPGQPAPIWLHKKYPGVGKAPDEVRRSERIVTQRDVLDLWLSPAGGAAVILEPAGR